MSEREYEILTRWQQQARSFSETMRKAGIHLGVGDPPSCPTCRLPWPCPDAGNNDA